MESNEACASCARLGFANLRGVRWRVFLGILPSSPAASVDEFRRVAADSRRRYASLRRRLLVDPHLPKDGKTSPDLVMDNPLSQNPDSMWGRFFRNTELEKMLDKDLSRLYPEHGSYFQTPACQAMLRRILLIWCLRHQHYGYKQGMHELLAPLLYVLHVDIQRLSEVRKTYEDHFTDEFDESSFPETDMVTNYRFTKNSNLHDSADELQAGSTDNASLGDLDSETRNIILSSDAYGAEGELGVLLSERFMEHDAYCLFDALMNAPHDVVKLAEFFSPYPVLGSSTYVLPVIEACSAMYHVLSIIDLPLHTHLIELGVEPQYFGLRWLRVLFGREFTLENLLFVWDEVFSYPNGDIYLNAENDVHPNFKFLSSPRGLFISVMAVSMILHLRSSLLATENATSCLQKLLNFPQNIDVKKLIEKARMFQTPILPSLKETKSRNESLTTNCSLSLGSNSPKTPLYSSPESYWEEKWRVLQNEIKTGTQSDSTTNGIFKGFIKKGKLSISRRESDPFPSNDTGRKKNLQFPFTRRLFHNKSQEPVVNHEDVQDSRGDALPAPKLETDKEHNEDLNDENGLPTSSQIEKDHTEASNEKDGFPISISEVEKDRPDDSNDKHGLPTSTLEVGEDYIEDSNETDGLSTLISGVEKDNSWDSNAKDDLPSSRLEAEEEDVVVSNEKVIIDKNFKCDPPEMCSSGEHSSESSVNNTPNNNTIKSQDSDLENGSLNSSSCGIDDSSEVSFSDKESTSTSSAIPKAKPDLHEKNKMVTKESNIKEKKPSNKFQWLWKFGRGNGDGNVDKGRNKEPQKSGTPNDSCVTSVALLSADACGVNGRMENGEKKENGNLSNLRQSMLENIQVIESILQQELQASSLENLSTNILGGKGQAKALTALKELRKISNLLSEM